LHVAGTSARDYLLNPDPAKDDAYRVHIQQLEQSGRQLLLELKQSSSAREAVTQLESHIQSLWQVLHAVALQGKNPASNYDFIQEEIAPKRNAAGQTLLDLETANYSALTESEAEFSATRSAAASKLLWLLAACLLG